MTRVYVILGTTQYIQQNSWRISLYVCIHWAATYPYCSYKSGCGAQDGGRWAGPCTCGASKVVQEAFQLCVFLEQGAPDIGGFGAVAGEQDGTERSAGRCYCFTNHQEGIDEKTAQVGAAARLKEEGKGGSITRVSGLVRQHVPHSAQSSKSRGLWLAR